jgi:hypothetical protein
MVEIDSKLIIADIEQLYKSQSQNSPASKGKSELPQFFRLHLEERDAKT